MADETDSKADERRHEFDTIYVDRGLEAGLERLRASNAFAGGVLRTLTIINGGAIVALFALIGNLAGKPEVPPDLMVALGGAFQWFVWGLVLSVVASLGAFYSQYCFYQVDYGRAFEAFAGLTGREFTPPPDSFMARGVGALWVGMGGAVVSLGFFAMGASSALDAGLTKHRATAKVAAVSTTAGKTALPVKPAT